MVLEVVQEDIEEDIMKCAIHPFKNNTPGAICAFCLQEKLGNLISSAFSVAIFPSSPSPPLSPYPETANSCTSAATNTTITSSAITLHRSASTHSNQIFTRKAPLPFMLAQRLNKKKTQDGDIAIRRCNSTTTPRQGVHFVDHRESYKAKKRGFWSFLYSTSSYSSSKKTIAKKINKTCKDLGFITSPSSSSANMSSVAAGSSRERKNEENMVVEEHEISKVSRSRSVGCGSRSFSGDFFGRISTGFGDCTLRRVESQREVKAKNGMHKNGGQSNGQDCINERVKCGGIFGSFRINNSSSSSSSSLEDRTLHRRTGTPANASHHKNPHQAFASPMRSLSSKDSTNNKTTQQKNNVAPNLTLIPALHDVRSSK